MSQPLALIVDDEPDIRELLEMTLKRMDVDTCSAANLEEARDALTKQEFNLCLTDMRLPDGNGIDLVALINRKYPHIPVAVVTAYGNMESAVLALKAGAFDFVSKPVNLRALRSLVGTALKLRKPGEGGGLKTNLRLIGNSPAMHKVRDTITKLARSQAPVYVSGESGVGKEIAARLIHAQSPRANEHFVPVNCGAIPGELMESEFFGHKKGSFTGATADKDGLFQTASGGTLFLDEVADLPPHMQVKLLRAIQEKAVRPVGMTREVPVDVRLLSATHRNLARLVEEGALRQDLYYRINVIQLDLPALRERPEDIPELADYLLDRLATSHQIDKPELAESALDKLSGYAFPGNVRELENVLERAVTLCEGGVISADDLQVMPASLEAPGTALDPGDGSLEDYMAEIEKDVIVKALEETGHNKTAAARKLGITFRALRYRLKKLGLE
jgi:two-component system response regulator PilR (NtrC family)